MRIVYLHQHFKSPTMVGGTRSYEMGRRFAACGHEVHMITSDSDADGRSEETWRETDESGIRVHWTPVPYNNKMSYLRRIDAFIRFATRAAGRARALRGDVVFATSTPLTIALPGVYAAWRNRTPFVFEVRDLWPELPIAMKALRNPLSITAARALEAFAYQRSTHIVALSPGMRTGVVKRGIDPARVSVVPNSCDLDLFDVPASAGRQFREANEWLHDRPLVVYTGTLGRINGVGYLARVAAEVARRDANVRFLVVGGGYEEGQIRQQAEQLGVLNRNLFMMGSLPKHEIPTVLSAADIATSLFIDLPEMWANSANKFFDALAAGRPVAINHEGWLADLIRERGIGLVLHPHDVGVAAGTLLSYLHDETTMALARESARCTARELFNRDVLASQLEDVLLTACGQDVHSKGICTATQRAA